jgi:phosphatidylglycerol lysyltransferase
MFDRVRHALPWLAGLAVFLLALEVLRVELHAVSWHEITADVFATPLSHLLLAVGLTVLNYAVLTAYDFVAFAYIGRRLAPVRIAVASFLAYAIANNVGFAMLSGASVRYRFYSRWGIGADDLSRIVFSYSVTFWLGLLAMGGVSLIVTPLPEAADLPARWLIAPAGWTLLAVVAAYLIATVVSPKPLSFGRFVLPLPRPAIGVAQLTISSIDWALAGAVLYVLLPPVPLGFLGFLGAFLAAQLLGLISHVPGGVGVFEGLMVLLLGPSIESGRLLPALVVYRAVYYVLPLLVALVALVADEVRQRRAHAARVGALIGQLTEMLTPRLLAAFTFLAGLMLLVSGATPAAEGRLAMLDRILPLGIIEVSHLLGSIVGVALLILSQGLSRRLDAAFYLTAGAMVVGMTTSLLKGFDFEEASLLAVVLVVLWRARPAFDRRAAFFETRFSVGWTTAVAGAVAASLWLGLFAFKHVDYSHDLWWQFELRGEASRFLRASVAVVVAVGLFAFARLMGHAPAEAAEPTDEELATAAAIIATQSDTTPMLVYLRDKALLFDEANTAFVMYGVQGRTWVAMSDPVGPQRLLGPMIRTFLERADDFGAVPVFYEVTRTNLHHYADFGLTFVKLGEEAVVDLTHFTLEGGRGARARQSMRRLEKDGGRFRIVDQPDVAAILPDLKRVSDNWMRERAGAEKGFSLGFFDETYLARFPMAVVEREGTIQAFANIWLGPTGVELSIDLMRYHEDAPNGVMEALIMNLLNWGKTKGYRHFSLGMAPLSGMESSPVASLWQRLGAFLYEHGEAVYRFQGLRAYKEKFDPAWEPRYLAYPGGLHLPRVLADVSALIAGGYRKIFLK